MGVLRFRVPGEPRGKGRPRIVKIGGFSRLAPEKQTVAYEKVIAAAARSAMGDALPFLEPLAMTVVVNMVPAASASRPKRAAMLSGATPPAKKPDLDNVIKAILDGCNGVAFRDDVQVIRLTAEKRYAEIPGVMVEISEVVAT
jgi:Holliday junction resolvase RusA-like endonuclease